HDADLELLGVRALGWDRTRRQRDACEPRCQSHRHVATPLSTTYSPRRNLGVARDLGNVGGRPTQPSAPRTAAAIGPGAAAPHPADHGNGPVKTSSMKFQA